MLLLLLSEPIYWTELDGETALVFRKWPLDLIGTVPIVEMMMVVGETWRCLLLGGGPTSLVVYLMQVLLPINERYDLLLEAEGVDEGLLLLLDRVFVRAVDRRLLKGELTLLVFHFRVFLGFDGRGDIPMEADCVSAVVPIGDRAVVAQAGLCPPALHHHLVVLMLACAPRRRPHKEHLLIGRSTCTRVLMTRLEWCIPSSDRPCGEMLYFCAVLAPSSRHILYLAQLSLLHPRCLSEPSCMIMSLCLHLLTDFQKFGDFSGLNVTRGHRLIVERLRVKVDGLVLVDGCMP